MHVVGGQRHALAEERRQGVVHRAHQRVDRAVAVGMGTPPMAAAPQDERGAAATLAAAGRGPALDAQAVLGGGVGSGWETVMGSVSLRVAADSGGSQIGVSQLA